MHVARTRHPVSSIVALVSVALLTAGVVAACDKDDEGASTDDDSKAVAPADKPGQTEGEDDHHEREEEDHAHEHGEEGVHIADAMYELSRRFSAIWFAGQVENRAFVDYEIHEIEELQADLAAESPKEAGVDVAARLKSDVVEPLGKLSTAVGESDLGKFDDVYHQIMKNCETCHADTGHDFINLKEPEYNPYPNLDLAPRD